MTELFIVGFDGTEPSERAARYAAVRAKAEGANLHLLHVLEWSPYSFLTQDELHDRHRRRNAELARAATIVEPMEQEIQAAGVTVTSEVRHGHAATVMCEVAKTTGATQMFVGRTGSSSLAERLLGGLTFTLVQASPVPVTVVP
ncbi:universal stress protein [Marinivivus vitaminiproducens]|uniref:universal stress protein n=1 Tax=Marinivivus vitaminiproducens TaxID=3035935 RepID=UPI00279D7809|nr:universal stress protein [Geminicoccaceae bacterium SCSIO 64248]